MRIPMRELFNLYVDKIAVGVASYAVLTVNLGKNVETVAHKYALGRQLQLRTS